MVKPPSGQMVAFFSMCEMNKPHACVTTSTPGHGFTVIELMVVVAIAAVVLGLALPSFDSMVKRWRTRTAAENLVSAIYLARSEAARFGGVQLANSDELGCPRVTGQWQCGWKIQTLGSPPQILQRSEAVKHMLITRRPAHNVMNYNAFGQLNGLAAYSFVVVHQANQSDRSKAITICVSSAGRVRTVLHDNVCA